MSSRPLHSNLKELSFHFQSVQLFLEHLELRFQRLLPQLEALLPQWQNREAQAQALEQELDSTCQEVSFLQRELEGLERVVSQRTPRVTLAQSQLWQGELEELALLYQQLWQNLEHSQKRFQNLEQGVLNLRESVLEQDSELARLQEEQVHLNQSLHSFEQSEQEYLALLNHKEKQLQELRTLYEFELEQLSQELHFNSRHEQNRQQQSQNIGKSLARLAQERNAILQTQEELREALWALEQDNQHLQDELDEAESQLAALQATESDWQISGQTLSAEILIYRAFWETLHGLGLDLSPELGQQVASQLKILPGAREHLETRLRLQPGRLSQTLQRWVAEHGLDTGSKASTAHALAPAEPFVWIPAGTYALGDDLQPAERPRHDWDSSGFGLGRLLVTNADFARFMQAEAYANPDLWLPQAWELLQAEGWTAPAFWNRRGYQCGEDYPDYPVVGVSWYEAMAYAEWAGAMLPSEAEWEAAGRGGEAWRWPWGDEWQEGRANTADAGVLHTTPVGLYPEGASPFGCLDLVGNVFEWTRSLYRAYPYALDGREELRSTEPRTLRGCSWNHKGAYFTRLSYRFQAEPSTRHSDIGFRLACLERDQCQPC